MLIKSSSIHITQRLILRHFTEYDVEALFKLLNDETVTTYLPWFPVKNREEANTFLEERFLNE